MPAQRSLTLALTLALVAACGGDDDPTTAGASTSASTTEGPGTATTTAAGDTASTVCGDGVRGGDELCDGDDLDGASCASVGAGAGDLACAADCQGYDQGGCHPAGAAAVRINEVMAKDPGTGPYAALGDAIELINLGPEAAALGGWRLSDDVSLPVDHTYVFPPGIELAPGAFLVLTREDAGVGLGALPFGVAAGADETLVLVDAGGVLVDQRDVHGEDQGSACGLPDAAGAWQICLQTLGAANAPPGMLCGDGELSGDEPCDGALLGASSCADLGYAGGAVACLPDCTLDGSMCAGDLPLAINELEATDDRIELVNDADEMIDLTGWILTDKAPGPGYDPAVDDGKLVFPGTTTIPAHGYMVVDKGDMLLEHPFGLGQGGDTVTLLKPDLSPVTQVTYAADQAASSYCRLPDGPGGAWVAGCTPTFGASNEGP
ncbi:MAG: lamin tail domain-containing protein [Nannocystaceae bacterium]